jgi:hypothetical protein
MPSRRIPALLTDVEPAAPTTACTTAPHRQASDILGGASRAAGNVSSTTAAASRVDVVDDDVRALDAQLRLGPADARRP